MKSRVSTERALFLFCLVTLGGCMAEVDGGAGTEAGFEGDSDTHAIQPGVAAREGDYIPGEPALFMAESADGGLEMSEEDVDKRIYPAHPFTRVTNASALPARAVVQLVTTYPNGTMWRCTGTVVAKDSVLTAAHCFFNTSRGGWARSVELTPARVDAGRPQGRTWGRSLSASQLFRDREAANLGTKSEEDYGIIRTFPMQGTTTEIGDKVGTIGITTVNPTSSALNWALTLRGYPDNALPNFMYTSNDKVRTTFARGIFNHQASSLEGLSGAGAMRTANSLFGIHVGEGVGTNYGLLITSAIRATLTAWMAL